MSKGTVIFAFLSGAAIGSIVTWKLVRDKYEQLAREEIQEAYSRKSNLKKVLEDVDEVHEIEEDEYKRAVHDYVSFSTVDPPPVPESREEDEPMAKRKPYVVSPEDFGDIDEYDTKSLTYWKDGVLTDENDKVVKDVESLVTEDALTHFGEYEDDSVFVRNDSKKTDYEILLDTRRYSDVHPHRVEE